MGIQINGNTNNINAGIGSLSIEDIRELDITGIATASNFKTGTSNVHSTGYECTNVNATGVITATSFVGSGSNLTGLVSLANGADNRVITASSASALNGEANLTYDGNNINLAIDNSGEGLRITASGNHYSLLKFDSNASSAGGSLCNIQGHWNGTEVANIIFAAGDDTSNKDDGYIRFLTTPSGGSSSERLRITSDGYLYIRDNGVTQTNTTLSYQSEGGFLTHYTARTTAGGDKYRRMLDIASVGANPWGSSIRFLTSADSTNPATTIERVRIDHNGRIGINKSTPQTMLSIKAERSAVPRFGIDGHYSDSSYTQSTWDDSSGLYTLLGVNHKLDANGNDATPVSSLHSASIFLDGRGGNIRFFVKPNSGTSFTEVARITDNGRFGIGTGSPDHKFEVEDNNSSIAVSRDGANAQLLFKSNSVAQAGQIQVSESSGGGAMGFFNKNTSGVLRECFRLSPTYRTVSFFQAGTSYPAGSSHDEQYYQFCNSFAYNYVMRMRNLTWGYGLRIDVDDDSTREGLLIYSTKSGVTQSKASIHMDGTYRSRNNTYTSYSDIKLKENIVDAESQWNDIKGLKVRNFNFKIDDPSQKMIGVIAQEAETVCPNLVRDIPDTEEKDGEIHETGTHTKEVKYSILYMKAIKCLQEAQARIETLEAKVAALEGS